MDSQEIKRLNQTFFGILILMLRKLTMVQVTGVKSSLRMKNDSVNGFAFGSTQGCVLSTINDTSIFLRDANVLGSSKQLFLCVFVFCT